MRTRKMTDRILLESLVNKYGAKRLTSVINKMNENANSDFEIINGVLIKYHGNSNRVVIPDEVTKIGYEAFKYKRVRSVEIPNTCTEIYHYAFYECDSLENIKIPNSVNTIGHQAFGKCKKLRDIKIPNSVNTICQFAFCGCVSLENIEIPNSITKIDEGTFADCTSLENIEIPDSVKYIGKYAFDGCRIKNLIMHNADNINIEDVKIKNFLDNKMNIQPSSKIKNYDITRDEIESNGYETQLRNLHRISEWEFKGELYCWLNGESVEDIPDDLNIEYISLKSDIFGKNMELIMEVEDSYLIHDGTCVVLQGTIGMP